jgi:single-stranded-DNA-specific exonuclease
MVAIAKDCGDGLVSGSSARGLKWKVANVDERVALSLSQKVEIPEILAAILYNRGVRDTASAFEFLSPTLRSSMPNPMLLKDMDIAAERIARAILNQEKIAIFGDYDVDGATSSALLKRFFGDLGVESEIYIPNRILEGYGPTAAAFEDLMKRGNSLIITVDCGTVSFEAMEFASNKSLDVIVLDHHLGGAQLPPAYAIVNPNRVDDDFEHKHLAAVGVVFFAATAVRGLLRDQGYFNDHQEPDLMMYLDLVALGTVCDVMELKGLNRAFVTQGLKLINHRTNKGIAALSDVAKIDSQLQSYHLGFVIGPRINAGGRVGRGDLGAELLATNDATRAQELALTLERLNQERKTVESIIFEEAIIQVEATDPGGKPMIMVVGEDWHQGVLGIIASRLKERYGKPSIVISTHGGIGKGSSRSITGVDIGSMLAKAKAAGILTQGGGHAMAGGFSLDVGKMLELEEFLTQTLAGSRAAILAFKEVEVDCIISLSGITGELAQVIARASPFGSGNPQPRFLVPEVLILDTRVVGENHLMLIVGDANSPRHGGTIKCMMFKALDTGYGLGLLRSVGKKASLLGSVQLHYQDAKRADLILEDIILL